MPSFIKKTFTEKDNAQKYAATYLLSKKCPSTFK